MKENILTIYFQRLELKTANNMAVLIEYENLLNFFLLIAITGLDIFFFNAENASDKSQNNM